MPANIVKIVDLGGGGDFSSLAAFIAWLYNNYNPLDRNACAICRVSSGNTYGDSASWGSLPTFSGNATIVITATKDHWFNGIFSSTRYYIATNPAQPTYWYNLVFHRVQIGAPGQSITGTIRAGLYLCGVVSSASTVVNADVVANSMIICTVNNQTAVYCQQAVSKLLVTRNLLLTRPGYTGSIGIRADSGNLQVRGNHIVRFTIPVNSGGQGYTYGNSTTASSINPDSGGNILNATPTFVDETNWNYVLSIDDTSAKDLYGDYVYGGVPVSLYHDGITGYRFPRSSIGPTDPDPGTYAPWVTKVVDTDGRGDFTSLNAAFVWLYNTYPNLVTSNIRVKFICKGTATDSTAINTTISTTDPRHYIHVVADDSYRFKGTPNVSLLYKRAAIAVWNGCHVILEGIQINQGSDGLSSRYLIIGCYVSIGSASELYGNHVNNIIVTASTNVYTLLYNGAINCTIINTDPTNGIVMALAVSINCIVTGAYMNNLEIEVWTLGTVTNYSSRSISMYCKYGESIAFRNPSAGDYRLTWTDTAAKHQGIYTGSYLENVVDLERQTRPVKSSLGADEPALECTENLYASEIAQLIKFLIDHLFGLEMLGVKKLVDKLYSLAENIYRGALSGRILIRVQKKISRIYRI